MLVLSPTFINVRILGIDFPISLILKNTPKIMVKTHWQALKSAMAVNPTVKSLNTMYS